MQQMLKNEWNKLLAIRNGAELYRIFFRITQVGAAVGLVLQLFMLPIMLAGMAYGGEFTMMMPFYIAGLLLIVGSAMLSEYALRCVERGQFRGVVIGLLLAGSCMPSIWFLLGLFGFYCFLNPEFQKAGLVSAPEAFLNLLSAIRLNFTGRAVA